MKYLILASVLFSLASKACPNFHAQVDSVLAKLQRAGVQTISGKTIESIRAESKNLKIEFTSKLERSSGYYGTHRSSGQWNKASNTITLSENHCQKMREANTPFLNLHEVLGPLGIDDNNFNKTGAASILLIQTEMQRTMPQMIKNPAAIELLKRNIEFSGGGGTTGVDGGGDGRVLGAMMLLQSEMSMLLNFGYINEEQYLDLSAKINSKKLEFKSGLAQGEILYDRTNDLILFPSDSTADSNINVNSLAARNFLIQFL